MISKLQSKAIKNIDIIYDFLITFQQFDEEDATIIHAAKNRFR